MFWLQKVRTAVGPLTDPHYPNSAVASVLLTIGQDRDSGEEQILLTKRTLWVETHKGQVSLPGGFKEPADQSLVQTALRECHEEIGIPPSHLHLLGSLAPEQTPAGVHIFPWVAELKLPYPFKPNPQEVERVIFLPLDRLMHEGLAPVWVQMGERRVQSLGIEAEQELVWGATARILDQFRQLLLNAVSRDVSSQ